MENGIHKVLAFVNIVLPIKRTFKMISQDLKFCYERGTL